MLRFPLLPLLLCACAFAQQPYDLLIRNARVLDGAGNPWFRADIAVSNGRIVKVGVIDANAAAAKTIDARDRYIAPGFIDVHTHVEGNLQRSPFAENFLRDGVTTVVTGNCGGSRNPLNEWYAELEKSKLGINVASFIGHNTVRSAAMGAANRAATPQELERMKEIVDRAMRDGAVGLSTGLEYIPGAYAPSAEIVELAKVAASYGGIYTSHMRDEGAKVLDAMNEALSIGREARIRVEISHLKMDTKRYWGTSEKMTALLDSARNEGIDVTVDQYPYDRSSTSLSIRIPSWALADGPEAMKNRLTTPSTRAEIAAEMKRMLAARGHEDYSYAMVASTSVNRRYEGKTIPEVTRMMGREPTLDNQVEIILDIQFAGGASMVYHVMSEQDVETILRWPHTAIASDGGVRTQSDGMTHPRSYGTNARILARFVREKKTLTLEDAIRRMTSLPARTVALHDRGLIREGMAADLVVFDANNVTDAATFTDPHRYSQGFDTVVVNGAVVLDESRDTGARAGRVLRGPGFTSK